MSEIDDNYFVCPDCEEIASRGMEDSVICKHCYRRYCNDCVEQNAFRTFVYNGEDRCSECFSTCPDEIKDDDLLELAMEKLGTNRKRLRDEILANGPERFRVPPNTFECTFCPPGECASKLCVYVEEHLGSECANRLSDHVGVTEITTGYCCRAREEDNVCTSCELWELRRVARILIGMRKFRKTCVLAQLPRDVLRMCIIEPYITY
jgi:hypothetical protein